MPQDKPWERNYTVEEQASTAPVTTEPLPTTQTAAPWEKEYQLDEAGEATYAPVVEPTAETDRPTGINFGDVPEIVEGLPYGVGEAIETLARASDVMGVPGMRGVIDYAGGIKRKFPRGRDTVVGTALRGGIESTINSLLVGGAGAIAGFFAGGPPGAVLGFSGTAGGAMGLAEYSKFMDELAEVGAANGLTKEEITDLQEEMKGEGIVSGIAEGGFEAVSNLLQARLLGFIGKRAIKAVAADGLKGVLTRFGIGAGELALVEAPSELATGFVQSKARESAGIPTQFGKKEIVDTIGATIVQSLLFKGGAMAADRTRRTKYNDETYKDITEQKQEAVEPFAPVKQTPVKNTASIEELSTETPLNLKTESNQDLETIAAKFTTADGFADFILSGRFHGSPHPIKKVLGPDEFVGENSQYYGTGFYTTDNFNVAEHFSTAIYRITPTNKEKGTAIKATIYKVQAKKNVKLFDYRKPVTPEIAQKIIGTKKVDTELLASYKPGVTTTQELIESYKDSIRDDRRGGEKLKALLDDLEIYLEDLNYKGQIHEGGLSGVSDEVRVYWSPDDLTIEEFPFTNRQEAINYWSKQRKIFLDKKTQEWANKTVEESPVINEQTADPLPDPNAGIDAKTAMNGSASEQATPTATNEEAFRFNRFNKQPIADLSRRIGAKTTSPIFFFRKESGTDKAGVVKTLPEKGPMRTAFEIDLAERTLRHKADTTGKGFAEMQAELGKEVQLKARKLLNDTLVWRNKDNPQRMRDKAKADITAALAEHPQLAKVLNGTKNSPGLLTYFENTRNEYKESRRQVLRNQLADDQFAAFDAILKDPNLSVENAVVQNLDLQSRVQRKQAAKGKAFERLSDERQLVLLEAEAKKQIKELEKVIDEHKKIDTWGIDDYVTQIEKGAYRIHDANGRTFGFAETFKEARKRAFEIRQQRKDRGQELPKLDISLNAKAGIDPTKGRQDVLRGTENIFDALKAYDYYMRKHIEMDPLIARFKQDQKLDPSLYDKQAVDVIQGQIDYIMGNKYSWSDQATDAVLTGLGFGTGKFSQYSAKTRSFFTNAKLGYRPVSAAINFLSGHGNTFVALGAKTYAKARQALATGVYTGPDGRTVNMTNVLKRNMDLLGIDLTGGDTGKLYTKVEWWKPLGLFTRAESSIRKTGFTANYIYMREELGLEHDEAVTNALLNLTYQNFSYNLAALPAILRSPGSKLVGQFKSYMLFQSQFLSQLNGKQWVRAVGVQMALGGPRSLVYLFRSLPFVAAFGLLDEAEEYLLKDKGVTFDTLTRGIGGLMRGDVTAAVAMQLPTKPEDWAGTVIATMAELWRDVLSPLAQQITTPDKGQAPGFIGERFEDWLGNLATIYRYLQEFGQSLDGFAVNVDFTKEKEKFLVVNELPETWIRDSRGRKSYAVGNMWDRLLLLAGVAPIERTRIQSLQSLDFKRTQIRVDNRRQWMKIAVKTLNRGENLDADLMQDAALYGINPQSLPTAFIWAQLTPAQRNVMQADLLSKAEKIDFYGLSK